MTKWLGGTQQALTCQTCLWEHVMQISRTSTKPHFWGPDLHATTPGQNACHMLDHLDVTIITSGVLAQV